MKKAILFAIAALSLNAMAASHEKATPVTFKNFVKIAQQEAKGYDPDGTCTFAAEKVRGGIKLTVTDENKKSAELTITEDTAIRLITDLAGDDSQDTYEFNGLGEVTFRHADDAFFSVDLSNDKHAASCEIDM